VPHSFLVLPFTIALGAKGAFAVAEGGPRPSPVLDAYKSRLALSEKQLPLITQAAEAAAARMLKNPRALINVPYYEQAGFAEEFVNRAGGLANAMPEESRPQDTTPDDIVLFSVRSWEKGWPKCRDFLAERQKKGWLVILFASKTGAPENLPADFLIDNGAASGAETEAAINTAANVTNGWLWCCEYVAALTRGGKFPGILKSIMLPGADDFDRLIQSPKGRHWLDDWDPEKGLPAGSLSQAYLKNVKEVVASLESERIRGEIEKAADLVSRRLADGKTVGVTSCTHLLTDEVFQPSRTPWKPFGSSGAPLATAFTDNVKQADLLLFFGYVGLSTPAEDFGRSIREARVDFIASAIEDQATPSNNPTDALVWIEQSWKMGDAVVPIPFPPKVMASVSGINSGLIFWMLDDAVAEKLIVLKNSGKH
jgi:hypothetical protein